MIQTGKIKREKGGENVVANVYAMEQALMNVHVLYKFIHCFSLVYYYHSLQVQAHGSDAMVDEDNCVFFLPHRPRSEICEPPFFLFMKGTGN